MTFATRFWLSTPTINRVSIFRIPLCRKADSSIRSVSFFIYTHTVYAMQTTRVELSDTLPLTCSRRGTCCFGNQVLLNPWELACLAAEKGISPRQFRDSFCDLGGTRLMFNGDTGWMGKRACGMYVHNFGCSLHVARPLACRLYPIGRQIQSAQVHYMYEGRQFPCLSGCPEVTSLPHITVSDYLQGQQTLSFEQAQDGYLEVAQNLADMALVLVTRNRSSCNGWFPNYCPVAGDGRRRSSTIGRAHWRGVANPFTTAFH